VAAASWYSQPGVVLDEPLQWQAPWWTCSRPGEHQASAPGIGGRVDCYPEPGPAGARVPDPGGVRSGDPGQRPVQQPAAGDVVLRDPGPGLRSVHQRRQHLREQGEQPLVIDPPGRQGIVERAVAPAELRLQRQLHH